MGEALAQAVTIGLAMALSPFPIIGIVLILAEPGGRVRGAAFLAGALGGVAVVSGAILALETRTDPTDGGDPATWVSILKLAIGVALLGLAARKWSARPRGGASPEPPAWMGAIAGLGAWRAAGMGILLSGINPKNVVLMAAATTSIAGAGAGTTGTITALVVFVAVGCAGVALPVAWSLLRGSRAARDLDAVRMWMLRHNATVTVVILLLIGAGLVTEAVAALAGG